MIKGLLVSLTVAAITLSSISASFAFAPVIRQLPNIQVGDMEENSATTDNNFFVFSNAFKFDDFVLDSDTTISDLIWTFDEGTGQDGDNRWYKVNGADSLHVGDAAFIADGTTSNAAHLNPAAQYNVRAASPYASFRDVVFSPGTAGVPPGFASPVNPAKSQHATGKVVRFFVSDQTNVAYSDILVKTVDNAFDNASGEGAFGFHVNQDDTFTTQPENNAAQYNGWLPLGFTVSGFSTQDYDATAQALRGVVVANATRYRVSGWQANQHEWLPMAAIGTTNYVRGKFYVYATGMSNPADLNQIPNLRLRLNNRFAVNAMLEVQHHGDTTITNLTAETRPSTSAAAPSIYRVDFAPVNVPYLLANAGFEGVGRGFEAYAANVEDNGAIGLAESVIGVYPIAALTPTTGAINKTYTGTALNTFNASEKSIYNFIPGSASDPVGTFLATETVAPVGIQTNTASGTTFDTTGVGSNRIAVVSQDFNPDSSLTVNNATRVRVSPNQQYMVRWHVTSTQNVNQQAQIQLRARTLKFQWSEKLEIGGAWGTGGTINYANPGANNVIAQQALPGIGTQNPDGGWYTQFIHTPMSPQIQASQPNIYAQPGPGNASTSRRDLFVGATAIDSTSGNALGAASEKANFSIDQVQVKVYDLLAD